MKKLVILAVILGIGLFCSLGCTPQQPEQQPPPVEKDMPEAEGTEAAPDASQPATDEGKEPAMEETKEPAAETPVESAPPEPEGAPDEPAPEKPAE